MSHLWKGLLLGRETEAACCLSLKDFWDPEGSDELTGLAKQASRSIRLLTVQEVSWSGQPHRKPSSWEVRRVQGYPGLPQIGCMLQFWQLWLLRSWWKHSWQDECFWWYKGWLHLEERWMQLGSRESSRVGLRMSWKALRFLGTLTDGCLFIFFWF